MRIALKILAAPALCLLALTVAVCSFLLLVAGFVCWFLCVLACIGGIVLLFTHHPDGGIAFLVIAFLVSPYGLPALFAWVIGKLNALRWSLKEFILE
jgi:hypothetical protein